jgi:hypothetical protein
VRHPLFPPRHRAGLCRALAVVLPLTFAGAVLLAPAAGAHGQAGEITVLDASPAGPLAVTVEVGIVFGNDGDPAEGATVTATLTGPGGAEVGPVPLPAVRGARYGSTIEVPAPGPWTVAVASTDPAGTASAAVEVPTAPATTTTMTTTTTTAPAPGTTAATVAPAGEDGPNRGLIVLATLAIAAAVVVVVLLIRRGRTRAD